LHPLAWWLWSALLATTLVRLHITWLTLATIAALSVLVKLYKSDGPWAESFSWALKLALAVILFRIFIGVIIGVPVPGHVLITLPKIPLPDWMAGITLGGAVTWERVSSAAIESLNIASIIAIFGAATSLTNPRAVLRSIPPIFYEVGMVLVIATTLTPQLVANLKRIRIAQQLRGISNSRFFSWRQIAMPLLEDSLARALDLAAAMDSRGYGYSRKRSKYRPQKFTIKDAALVTTSLLFLAVSL
jgi:energy-coupling factor transport system permease protein